MAKSLQDILKRRQQEEFVGREEQLIFFRRDLRCEPDNDRRHFVVNVFGQGSWPDGRGSTRWWKQCLGASILQFVLGIRGG